MALAPATAAAYDLLHQGCLALSQVEQNGIRIDRGWLERAKCNVTEEIALREDEMRGDPLWKRWRRRYGAKANIGSRPQLGTLLFEELGYKSKRKTETGRHKTDAKALEAIDLPFVKAFLKVEKLKKLRGTYLLGIERECVGETLHPVFNLHTTVTYRSSCDSPNFQNLPIRDPESGQLIRRCFIPRPGRRLVEIDYVGIEVRVAACYNQDPRLIEYIRDPSKDMHRDMAAQCFMVEPEQVNKMLRYCAKNMYVFPEFYGSYWAQCATDLWEAIDHHDLTVEDRPLKEHLKEQGIRGLGKAENTHPKSFMAHIKKVEEDFWNRRFRVYAQWKREHYLRYQREGGANTLTGFRLEGYFGRNDIINYPIQGSAFHCLLASMIRIQRALKKRRMQTLLVGQIHDSLLADVPESEYEEYLQLARRIMTVDLMKRWEWINVPIEVEAEATPVDGAWSEKKGVTIA